MRITRIFDKLRHKCMPQKANAHKTTGYKILIDGVFFYRHEECWHRANRLTRELQRQGIKAEFIRVNKKAAA